MTSQSTMVFGALACVLLLGADPNLPHDHQGSLDPFEPGPPPPLSASEQASLAAGKSVQKTVELENSQGARALASFHVAASPEVVWACINDIRAYPRMVPGVSAIDVYAESASRGAKLTSAKYTIALLGYKLSYYVAMRYDPRASCMTFKLDYSRLSDVDDAVGYWHVAPHVGVDGEPGARDHPSRILRPRARVTVCPRGAQARS